MPDQTNITDFDPATGRTTTTLVEDHDHGSQDYNTQVGQEHDTWHRPDGGGTTPGAPVITGLSVITIQVDVTTVILVHGTGFKSDSVVYIDGVAQPTIYVSATELEAEYTPAAVGQFDVTVHNGSTVSNAVPLTVVSATAPEVSDAYPTNLAVGVEHIIHVQGRNFVNGSVVLIEGELWPTTFVSDTELDATFTPQVLGGPQGVTVRNPNGDVSPDDGYVYVYVDPFGATSITPEEGPIGVPVDITVIGSGFTPETVLWFSSNSIPEAAMPTTYVSPTELHGTFTPAANTSYVWPRIGTTNGSFRYFYADAPVPTVTSITPSETTIGKITEFTIIGTGFTPDTNAAIYPFTYGAYSLDHISPTEMRLTFRPLRVGEYEIRAQSGDRKSDPVYVTSERNVKPTVTSVTPSEVQQPGVYSATIIGTGFTWDTRVEFDNVSVAPQLVSETELSVTVDSMSISPGPVQVEVTNGFQTNFYNNLFKIVGVPVTLESITPNTVSKGEPTWNFALVGTGFGPYTNIVIGGTYTGISETSATEATASFGSVSLEPGVHMARVENGADAPSNELPVTVEAAPPPPAVTSITPNTCTDAQVGSVPATIVGTGLANCTSVQLVSADRSSWWPTTVTSTTDTQIDVQTITSPTTEAGDYTIVVTDMVTNLKTNELPFTVTAAPPPPPSVTGPLSASLNYITVDGPLVGALPAVDSVSTLTINGTDLGRHQLAEAIPTYDGYWCYGNGGTKVELRATNLDGVNNQALYTSLSGQTVTIAWTPAATVQEDPASYTIASIKEWVDNRPDLADEVLAAEEARGDDGRVTLLNWLQGFIAHRDED